MLVGFFAPPGTAIVLHSYEPDFTREPFTILAPSAARGSILHTTTLNNVFNDVFLEQVTGQRFYIRLYNPARFFRSFRMTANPC